MMAVVSVGGLGQDVAGQCLFAGVEQGAGHAQLTGQDQGGVVGSFGGGDGAVGGHPSGTTVTDFDQHRRGGLISLGQQRKEFGALGFRGGAAGVFQLPDQGGDCWPHVAVGAGVDALPNVQGALSQ